VQHSEDLDNALELAIEAAAIRGYLGHPDVLPAPPSQVDLEISHMREELHMPLVSSPPAVSRPPAVAGGDLLPDGAGAAGDRVAFLFMVRPPYVPSTQVGWS
jgi:hypothetical protein